MNDLAAAITAVRNIEFAHVHGQVRRAGGPAVEIEGLGRAACMGARVEIERGGDAALLAEIVSADRNCALAMPFAAAEGLSPGARVWLRGRAPTISPSGDWLGRVVDGLGRAVDDKGGLRGGQRPRLVRAGPPPAAARAKLGPRLETGVAAIDLFTPLCEGQRLGLFSGSGVGKSVLSGMLARFTDCDVAVIGLIGERGREVREFIEDELGAAGLAKSVVVVATSDESAVMRRQAAWTTLSIAEHFRDEGKRVFCLMDSVTRFAHACREIGLAAGEPPTTRGFTPSVFAELPRLLERAGPGPVGSGSITGLFSVLVEGGDMEEPVADAVRGILDGHVLLSRRISARGRYPAIDLLGSLSRSADKAQDEDERALVRDARALLATHGDMAELVRLGAYKPGANADVDRAVAAAPKIEALVTQARHERRELATIRTELEGAMA
ncbi:MAG: FliI/YscN family ATPase [Pacificimonas sp.]